MHRILTGLVAFALTGFVPFVSSSSATAAGDDARAAQGTTASTAVESRLPKRVINAKIVQKGARTLIFKGKVTGDPKYSKKVVKIERRIGKKGNWKLYAKVKSTSLGGWKRQVGAPRNGRWYFRAMTPKTNSYAKSYSDVWYTYSF